MRRIPLLLPFTTVLLALAAGLARADAADPWLGSFAGDKLLVEIGPGKGQGAYAGTIRRGSQRYSFAGQGAGIEIRGRFKSGEDAFDFVATLAGPTVNFQTGGKVYRLMRVGPPAPPTADPPAPTFRPAPASRPVVVTTLPTTQPSPIHKLTPVVVDDPLLNCEAATVQIRDGWKCRIDVVWRQNPYDPAVIAGTVSEPSGPARLTVFPRLSFIDGISTSNDGSGGYMGSEIRKPVASPGDYVRQIILPRFRSDVTEPRIESEIDLPEFARDQLPKFQKVPGVRVMASRVRIAYQADRVPVEEEFVCTVGIVPLPGGVVAWGAECSSYRAARGELDATLPLLRRVESSLRVEPQWYGGVLWVSQRMQQDATASSHDATRLSRYVSERPNDVGEPARQAYERRRQVLARCDADLDAAMGVTGR